jgi:hypothetical protein
MLKFDCEQNTPEWYEARLGIPTASSFEKILSPTGKLSTQAPAYMRRLVAEMVTGEQCNIVQSNEWMERGKELEVKAAHEYEAFYAIGFKVEPVGFCLTDDKIAGCSPDRLVGDEGLLEIKCPAPHTHIDYLETGFDIGYKPQVQGQLYVTGRKWSHWYSYHPKMKPVIIPIERDEEYIEKLDKALRDFHKAKIELYEKIVGSESTDLIFVP